MREVLSTVDQKDPLVELNRVYTAIVKNYIERAEDEVVILRIPADFELIKKDLITIPLSSEELARFGENDKIEEIAILDENLYLLLNQVVRERFLTSPSTKLIPKVGWTRLGFIIGTAVDKEKSRWPIAFFVKLPAFELTKIPRGCFTGYEASS